MVNPKFMMKTFTELLNDANKLKIESANKTSEIQKQLLGSFEDELKKIQQQISDNKIEYENMKNKLIEMEAKITENQSPVLVSNILIKAEKDFIFIGKSITLTGL